MYKGVPTGGGAYVSAAGGSTLGVEDAGASLGCAVGAGADAGADSAGFSSVLGAHFEVYMARGYTKTRGTMRKVNGGSRCGESLAKFGLAEAR